ncbi:MAG: UDP-N-acetylmuramoyl-tripeptide--D-alanyl-D-alanine ligase, partial [Marmoricola sp.]
MIPRSHYRNVVTSSLDAGPGDLFVALIGARDGHDFVEAAVAAGATGVVVSRQVDVPAEVDVYLVDDTLEALRKLAATVRESSSADVLAITGSVGKTTTKDVLAHMLSSLGRNVVSSPKSFNNHLGVPLTLLMLDGQDDLVAEVGTNHPGEIADLAALIRPRAAIVTNIGHAHLGNFESRDALADEKASLYKAVEPGGVWFVNADDDLLLAAVDRLQRPDATRVISYGTARSADVRASDVTVDENGTRGTLTANGQSVPFAIPLIGKHFAGTAAAAVAVAIERGLDLAEAAEALAAFPGSVGRASVTLRGNLRVIDDSYNGSPDSMLAALDTLASLPEQRRIAVLGEMRELGDWSDAMHEAVGAKAGLSVTDLIFIGPSFEIVRDTAMASGLAAERIHPAESATHAAHVLQDLLTDEPTAVLVKGSRFVHTERVALALEGLTVKCELAVCELYIHCRT